MTVFTPVRVSAMSRAAAALGARFTEQAGWKVADVYTVVEDEIAGARAGVGLADTSACGKVVVRGADVDAVVAKLAGRHPPAPGQASRERIDGANVLACRRVADEMLLLTGPADGEAVAAVVTRASETVGCAHVTDVTSGFAVVDLVGPRAGALLERLVPVDLSASAVPPLGVVQAELARVHAIVMRLDHATLAAFRVLVAREYGEFLWHTLLDAGHDLGLTLVGATALARLIRET